MNHFLASTLALPDRVMIDIAAFALLDLVATVCLMAWLLYGWRK